MQRRLLHQSEFANHLLLTMFIAGLVSIQLHTTAAANPLWKKLVPQKRAIVASEGDFTLTKEHGPWLIMAMYFSGEDGEAKARELVIDLRKNHRLEAYHWGMSFQLDNTNPGRGIDAYGSKIRRRYRRGSQVTQHAVLVGNFLSVGDPDAQTLLNQIKSITPTTLQTGEETQTAESLTNIDRFRNYLLKHNGKGDEKGPMSNAFVTRNPLLPKEYFVPVGVDKDVAKWNSGQEHSLLNCPGRFTVKVATFKGRTSLKKAGAEIASVKTRKPEKDDPLVLAVKNAHKLTIALREKGWEAYEFHDRFESYVTIGSFDEGQQAADGKILINHRDAQIIMDTFGATTPNNIFNRPAQSDLALEQQKKRQFESLLGNQGKIADGFHPKRFVGLPFDIYPAPIVVPKQSISSAYARN